MPDQPEQPNTLEAACTDLRTPYLILAEALTAVREMQALDAEITESPTDGFDQPREDSHRRLMEQAFQLAHIAKVAGQLATAGRTVHQLTDDDLDEADMEDRTVPPGDLARGYEPQASSGSRFTADITCRYLGRVADGLWAYAPSVGFLCVSGAVSIEAVAVGVTFDVQFAGRVVSATPDHVLCVTDGGTSVTLPRVLIVESADE